MTTDYIALGKLPLSEHYPEDKEFREKYNNKILLAYLNQLKRTVDFPDRLAIRELPSLGYFVAIDFNDSSGFEYAVKLADDQPYCWDERAREELGQTYFKDLRELISPTNIPNTPPQIGG